MPYYYIEFCYPGPYANFPDKTTEDACKANADADRMVEEKAAAEAGLEMRHAYSWPDGSLCKYIKTQKKTTDAEFRKIFDESSRGIVVSRATPEFDFQTLKGTNVTTLEERFSSFSQEEMWALATQREKEKDALFADYYKSRKECDKCTAPGLGCEECRKKCDEAFAAEKAWRAEERPLNSA
jgi:hypothetical protein